MKIIEITESLGTIAPKLSYRDILPYLSLKKNFCSSVVTKGRLTREDFVLATTKELCVDN